MGVGVGGETTLAWENSNTKYKLWEIRFDLNVKILTNSVLLIWQEQGQAMVSIQVLPFAVRLEKQTFSQPQFLPL